MNPFRWLLRLLRAIWWRLYVQPPGLGVRYQIGEDEMQVFKYTQALLAVTVAGVVTQRLRVLVDDEPFGEPIETNELGETSVEFEAGPKGGRCELHLDYIDADGNDSTDFVEAFTIEDTTGPQPPHGFGGREQIGERETE